MASSINKQEQKGTFTCLHLASNSQWRVIKEPAEAEAQFYSPWRVHLLGRRTRAAKLPIDDVAQTHWRRNINSPWRVKELAKRVDADWKFYK